MAKKADKNVELRQYTLTTGSYDDYKIVTWIIGPKDKIIPKLFEQFRNEYMPNYQSNFPISKNVAEMRAYQKNLDYKYDGVRKLQKAGYKGNSIVELFLDWLKKEHGFEESKSNEVWIES